MSKFESLTSYIERFEDESYGEWMVDNEHEGTRDNPIHFPYVNYNEHVECFINAVYDFVKCNPDMELSHPAKIVRKYDITSIEEADVSTLPAECVAALIYGAVRSESFCEGAILDYLQKGCIVRWLKRLREIDSIGE